MATKVDRRRAARPAAAGPTEAATRELEILHPERRLTIGVGAAARTVTVREYGFVEGNALRPQYKIFLDALYALISGSGASPTFEMVEDLLAAHQPEVLALIATAADLEMADLAALSDEDGYRLMQTWWVVNAGFFIRRLISLAARQAAQRRAAPEPQAGGASTTPSSPPATDAAPLTSAA